MSRCTDIVESGGYQIIGFSKSETASAICAVARYCKAFDGKNISHEIIKGILTDRLGHDGRGNSLSKAVVGGLQHVISVDNAAGYAELWYRGGSWYAVTDAALSKAFDPKTEVSAIWELPRITKGMKLSEAVPIFLEAIYGPVSMQKGCGCGQ
jgi:hypothetical protein